MESLQRIATTFHLSPPVLIALVEAVGIVLALFLLNEVPLRYNLRNLTVRWKTTAMTALAFTLVISLLTVMLAFVNGMYRLTESSGQPGNVIVLGEGMTDETFSSLSASDVGDIENQPGVLRNGNRPLASRETYIVVTQPIPNAKPGGIQRRFLQVRGVDDAPVAARVHGIRLFPGGAWYSEAGVQTLAGSSADAKAPRAIQAVLGEGIARQLGRDRKPDELAKARNRDRLEMGDLFSIGDRTWIVTGVMQSAGSTFDSEIWAKRGLVAPLFGKDVYTSVILRTADKNAAKAVKQLFNNYKKTAVQAHVETEYYASLSETNKQFLWAIAVVTVVMAIGGVFGVMNTMFAAISQRIKDIGVLRLLGYSRRQLLTSFLLESVVIALVGGLLGCALGSLCDGLSATSIVSGGQGGGKFVVLRLAVDTNILAVGLFLTTNMGLLGGLIPALSAMRLTPLEALR